MITVFWDCEGVILLVALLSWETVKSNTYVRTLIELGKHFRCVCPHKYLASARHCNATHKFEDFGCHHKICLDIVAYSTMQSMNEVCYLSRTRHGTSKAYTHTHL